MVQKCIMGSSGGGGGSTLQETSVTQGSKVTWTATTPSDLDIKNYVLSGTFYLNNQLDANDVVLTVSNPPKQDTPCLLSTLNGSVSRDATLKTNGQLIMNNGEVSLNAGNTLTIAIKRIGSLEYTG